MINIITKAKIALYHKFEVAVMNEREKIKIDCDFNEIIKKANEQTKEQNEVKIDLEILDDKDEINDFSKVIANSVMDTYETDNEARKKARKSMSDDIESKINAALANAYQENHRIDNIVLKIKLKQAEYSRTIAWKLRHGSSNEFGLYKGVMDENGFGNKFLSVSYNLSTFWKKSYFIEPGPILPKDRLKLDKLIIEAVNEISKAIK